MSDSRTLVVLFAKCICALYVVNYFFPYLSLSDWSLAWRRSTFLWCGNWSCFFFLKKDTSIFTRSRCS